MPDNVPGAAFRCEIDGIEPRWRVERVGDAAVSWACDPHLAEVCHRMQCDPEITELVVSDHVKRREWREIGDSLGGVR
jgi:hypothetical protein